MYRTLVLGGVVLVLCVLPSATSMGLLNSSWPFCLDVPSLEINARETYVCPSHNVYTEGWPTAWVWQYYGHPRDRGDIIEGPEGWPVLVLVTAAPLLPQFDNDTLDDVYVVDYGARVVCLVTLNDQGEKGDRGAARPVISRDAKHVAFSSWSYNMGISNYVPNTQIDNFPFAPLSDRWSHYVRDLPTSRTRTAYTDKPDRIHFDMDGPPMAMSEDGLILIWPDEWALESYEIPGEGSHPKSWWRIGRWESAESNVSVEPFYLRWNLVLEYTGAPQMTEDASMFVFTERAEGDSGPHDLVFVNVSNAEVILDLLDEVGLGGESVDDRDGILLARDGSWTFYPLNENTYALRDTKTGQKTLSSAPRPVRHAIFDLTDDATLWLRASTSENHRSPITSADIGLPFPESVPEDAWHSVWINNRLNGDMFLAVSNSIGGEVIDNWERGILSPSGRFAFMESFRPAPTEDVKENHDLWLIDLSRPLDVVVSDIGQQTVSKYIQPTVVLTVQYVDTPFYEITEFVLYWRNIGIGDSQWRFLTTQAKQMLPQQPSATISVFHYEAPPGTFEYCVTARTPAGESACQHFNFASITILPAWICEAGDFFDRETDTCKPCPLGSMSKDPGVNEQCVPCGPGMVTNAQRTQCQPCPEGTVENAGTCVVCPPDRFCPMAATAYLAPAHAQSYLLVNAPGFSFPVTNEVEDVQLGLLIAWCCIVAVCLAFVGLLSKVLYDSRKVRSEGGAKAAMSTRWHWITRNLTRLDFFAPHKWTPPHAPRNASRRTPLGGACAFIFFVTIVFILAGLAHDFNNDNFTETATLSPAGPLSSHPTVPLEAGLTLWGYAGNCSCLLVEEDDGNCVAHTPAPHTCSLVFETVTDVPLRRSSIILSVQNRALGAHVGGLDWYVTSSSARGKKDMHAEGRVAPRTGDYTFMGTNVVTVLAVAESFREGGGSPSYGLQVQYVGADVDERDATGFSTDDTSTVVEVSLRIERSPMQVDTTKRNRTTWLSILSGVLGSVAGVWLAIILLLALLEEGVATTFSATPRSNIELVTSDPLPATSSSACMTTTGSSMNTI